MGDGRTVRGVDALTSEAEYLEAFVDAVDKLAACYGSTLALLEADTFVPADIQTGRDVLLCWATIRGDVLEMLREGEL